MLLLLQLVVQGGQVEARPLQGVEHALRRLEARGWISAEWGASENNRRARFYRLTREGRRQLTIEARGWEQTAAIIARFFAAKAEDLQ